MLPDDTGLKVIKDTILVKGIEGTLKCKWIA